MKPINPVLLTEHKITVVFEEGLHEQEIAEVARPQSGFFSHAGNAYGGYVIKIYNKPMQKLALAAGIPEEQLVLGLLYHEIAHIRYDSFMGLDPESKLEKWIDNLIEDTRIEYSMSFEYPYVAKYIALILAAARDTIMATMTEEEMENDPIAIATQHLLQMAKYNYISPDCGQEFADFMYPRILLARRSNRQKAIQIVAEIYAYLTFLVDDDEIFGAQPREFDVLSQSEKGEEDKTNMHGKEGQKGEGSSGKSEVSKAEKAQEALEQLAGMAGGMYGGEGAKEVINDLRGSNDYIRKVVTSNIETIRKVHKAFSEVLTKNIDVPVKEGDINIRRLQQAYMNDMVAEEDYDYHIWQKAATKYDCVILRDTSGSIDGQEVKYAESTIILAKAIEELKQVNVAVIDFDSNARLVKSMNQELVKTGIVPRANGGTNLVDALEKMATLPFKNKIKLVVVITDGWPHQEELVKSMAQSKRFSDYFWLPIYFDSSNNSWFSGAEFLKDTFGDVEQISNIEELHKAVYRLLKRKVLIG